MNRIVRVACLLLLLAVATRAHAQQNVSAALTSTTCPGSGCVTLGVSGVGGVGVQITGTFTATVQFEGSVDGVTYAAMNMTPIASTSAVTSATAGGIWSGGVGGLSVVRVRVSAYTSGTVTVRIQNAPVSARSLVGSGGGTIGGSIAQNQVGFGASSDTLSGSNDFTWDGATLAVNGDLTVNSCTGCGGGTPGGSNTQIQFNNAGAFGGSANLTWDGTTFLVNGLVSAATGMFTVASAGQALQTINGMGRGLINSVYGTLSAAQYAYNANTYYGLIQMAAGNNAFGVYNEFLKTRSTDGATAATAQTNDTMMMLRSLADIGTGVFRRGGSFSSKITGAVGATSWPTQFEMEVGTGSGFNTYIWTPTLFTAPGAVVVSGPFSTGAASAEGAGSWNFNGSNIRYVTSGGPSYSVILSGDTTGSGGPFLAKTGSAGLYVWTNNTYAHLGSVDAGVGRNGAGVIEINNGTAGTFRDLKLRQLYSDQTITAGGTTGNQTINKAAGTVNFAAAATSLTVTDSLVTTSSTIYTMPRTDDATCTVKNVVPSSGSFVITMTAACTAETSVGFLVIN